MIKLFETDEVVSTRSEKGRDTKIATEDPHLLFKAEQLIWAAKYAY